MALVTFRNILEEDTVFTKVDKEYLVPCVYEYARTQSDEIYKEIIDQKVSLYVNNTLLKVDDWYEYTVTDEDTVIVVPNIRGGDTAGFVQIIIGALLIAASFYPSPASPYLLMAGISLMLGGVSQLLFQPDLPSLPFFSSSGSRASQTYSWSGMKTVAKTDTPIPVIYGTHKVAGNMIGIYVDSYGETSYLNMLIALGEGEIDGICHEKDYTSVCQTSNAASGNYVSPAIELDEQPIRVYNDVEWWYRTGTNTSASNFDEYYPFAQNKIPYFDAAIVQYSDDRGITSDGVEYTTHKQVNMVTVRVRANSLYKATSGGLNEYTANYSVEWMPEGGSYTLYEATKWSITVTAGNANTNPENCTVRASHGDYFYGARPNAHRLLIRHCGYDPDGWEYDYDPYWGWTGYQFFDTIVEVQDEDGNVEDTIEWTSRADNGPHVDGIKVQERWQQVDAYMVKFDSTNIADGNLFIFTPTDEGTETDIDITGKSKTPVWSVVVLNFDDISVGEGVYTIRVTRTDNGPSDDPLIEDMLVLDSVVETVQGQFIYPNTALLGLRIKANDQLSGAPPNVTTIVRGMKIEVPDLEDATPTGNTASFDNCYWDATNEVWIDSNEATVYWNDTSSWRTEYSNNSMLCVRDMMLNERYGLGNYIESIDLSDAAIEANVKECHTEYDPYPDIDYLSHWGDPILSRRKSGGGEDEQQGVSWEDYFTIDTNTDDFTITHTTGNLQLVNSSGFSKADIICKTDVNLAVSQTFKFSITVSSVSPTIDTINFCTKKRRADGANQFDRVVGTLSNVTDGTYTKEFVCIHAGVYEVVVSVINEDDGMDVTFTDISLTRETYSHYHTMNGVLESDQSALTALLEMCNSFRCWPVWYNGVFSFVLDIDETPVHTLSVGKTISFRQSFTPITQIPYRLIGQFADRDDGFDMRSMVAKASSFSNLTKLNEKTIGLKFITDKARAERELIYKLNNVTNCTHMVDVKCGLDKIHTTAGDIINIQNDLPSWGRGGIILDYTATNITMEATYTFTNVATDTFLIKYQDDENNYITATIDTTNINNNDVLRVVPLESSLTASPCTDSGYAMGTSDTYIKKFRMLTVSRTKENEVEFTGREHLSSLYVESSLCKVVEPPSPLPNPLAKPNPPRRTVVRQADKYEGIGFSFYAEFPVDDTNVKEVIVQMNRTGLCFTAYSIGPAPDTYSLDTQSNMFETVAIIPVSGGSAKYIDSTLSIDCTYDFRFRCRTAHKTSDFVEHREFLDRNAYKPEPPSGLRVINAWLSNSSNVSTFYGRDIEISWNPVGVSYNSALTIIGYKVEIYNGSTISPSTLLRTAFTPTEEYTYTLEDNIADSNTIIPSSSTTAPPSSTVSFRISSVNAVNIESDPSKPITVIAANPPAVTNLTGTAQEDAVLFEWDKATVPGLKGYYYRTKVSPPLDPVADWSSWTTITDNKVVRELTAHETVQQANGRSTVYIEVKAVSVYDKYSVLTTSTNIQCLNLKSGFIVSTVASEGNYTNLGNAIASVPCDGWNIFIKAGTYDLSSSIHFPNYSFDIEGVNRDAVIVRNSAGERGFVLSGNTYHFNNFTVTSVNSSPYSTLIYGANATNCKLSLSRVNINLNDASIIGNTGSNLGDIGVYIGNSVGATLDTLNTDDCNITGGVRGVVAYRAKSAYINNVTFDNQKYQSIYILNQCKSVNITNNKFNRGRYRPIYVRYFLGSSHPDSINISNNTISMLAATSINITGILAYSINNVSLVNNKVDMDTSTYQIEALGIYNSGNNNSVSNNDIFIEASASCTAKGIVVSGNNSVVVTDNIIVINAASPSGTVKGISLQNGDDIIINANHIDLMHNLGSSVGIFLDWLSSNNYGGGNITKDCGVSIDDDGSGNNVTAQDV